jgi:hypothetical protein
MNKILLLAAGCLVAVPVDAQDFLRSQPAGRDTNVFAAASGGLLTQTGATARELVTFRDPNWTLLTVGQIGAATADAESTLHNFHRCPTCVENGIARFVVGRRPGVHKYAIAGIIEIGVEAVAAHYLRNHGPIRRWYWRYVWTLPQSFSLYEHTHADFHNARLKLTCDNAGMNCF